MSRTVPPHERRRTPPPDHPTMRGQLNAAQRSVLEILEYFGWELRFVRRQFDPVPVVCAGDHRYAVIRPDGSIDDHPRLPLRG